MATEGILSMIYITLLPLIRHLELVNKNGKFTWHALDSMQDYDISIEKALDFLLFAEEVVKGHGGRFIAHRKLNEHLTRVVYEYDDTNIVVVTFYISYVNRYFKGGIYEDKILS